MAAWAPSGKPAARPLDVAEAREVIIRAMISPYRAIDDFLDDGLSRGWSQRTINTYRRILYMFADRLPVDYDVTQITVDDVRRFRGSMKGNARGTVAHAEAVLSSFFKWCFLNGKIKQSPMMRLERTKRQRAEDLDVMSVSTEDVPKLIAAARELDAKASVAA
jgi:site-specific recombinase XerD